jgi:pimeloyl-ACP methyl ester carboxylesterase
MTHSRTNPPINLNYTLTGSGADVLLIHGWASSERMWRGLAQHLRQRARTWAVDLYGFGASPRPVNGTRVDLDLHLTLLIDFCRQHGLRPKAVIGHSMGATLALKLAVEAPDLTERLVLMSPIITGRFAGDLNKLVMSAWAQYSLPRSRSFWLFMQSKGVAPIVSVPPSVDPVAAQRIREDFQRSAWQAAAYAIDSLARENMEPALSQIRQPTLVIVGAEDYTVPPEEGRLAARQMPKAQLLELAGIYHQALDEAPHDVMTAIEHFLTEI